MSAASPSNGRRLADEPAGDGTGGVMMSMTPGALEDCIRASSIGVANWSEAVERAQVPAEASIRRGGACFVDIPKG